MCLRSPASKKLILLQSGSPATPDGLRKRFAALISERGKGKDASKLRFVIKRSMTIPDKLRSLRRRYVLTDANNQLKSLHEQQQAASQAENHI